MLALALLAGALGPAATAEEPTEPLAEVVTEPLAEVVAEAIAYKLSEVYDVPLEEARVWAARQALLMEASQELAKATTSIWGGSRIDHESGTLVVNTTDPDAMARAASNVPAAKSVQIETRRVKYTLTTLNGAAIKAWDTLESYTNVPPLVLHGENKILVLVEEPQLDEVRSIIQMDVGSLDMFRLVGTPTKVELHAWGF